MGVLKKHNLSIFSFRFLAAVGVLFLICFCFFKLQRVFIEYDDIKKRWSYFYDLPDNSLDVLILGNSHAYSSYDPDIIDAICGTNSFVIASNSQKIEQVYYNLKEALQYQSPKVAVIQLTVLTGESWKTKKGEYRVYSNLDGMRYSNNKIQAVIAQRPYEDWINSMFPLFRNHDNWKKPELLSDNMERLELDFKKDFRGFSARKSEMGEKVALQYEKEDKKDFSNFTINNQDMYYLQKIKSLADLNGLKVVYVMSPKYSDLLNDSYFKKNEVFKTSLSKLGDEYLDFNMLSKKIGLEKRSFENGYISYQHTSYFGAVQISRYLGNHFKKKYFKANQFIEPKESWLERMAKKKEYYLYSTEDLFDNRAVLDMGQDLTFFDDVIVEKMFLIKQGPDVYELVLQFQDNVNLNKLSQYRFYVHLIPEKSKKNINVGKNITSFENYDFTPGPLPFGDGKFYVSREINTKIKRVKNLNIGLFKSGLVRSEKITVSDFLITNQ
ncbi:hypothetical protein [Zobellia barbeyronii]|uniref:Uncharacterized protein n=1 Tax=Zobellia barbeyronii TaxID=2748009 RepID=A0ABS5WB75_9FLAO|nr:hypothetical protein [Zobellia barbeyronii]MBT2160325.1 hypothetical protein [Zobellia barbeyronii]